MVTIDVLYFATLRDRLGTDRERFDLPADITDQGLLQVIATRRPEMADLLRSCRVAVDQAFARGPLDISGQSEVAILPPVSGG